MRRYYRLGIILVVVVVGIVVIESVIMNRRPDSDPDTPIDPYTLWQSHNISSYRIRVEVLGMPVPPAWLDLVVRNGEIIEETILSCRYPSEEFPEGLCEPTTTRMWNTYMARTTIEELFEDAEFCVARTQTLLENCPSVPDDFMRFEDRGDMYRVGDECQSYIAESYYGLCTVYYDETYGYPIEMYYVVPGVDDGVGIVFIRHFEPLD